MESVEWKDLEMSEIDFRKSNTYNSKRLNLNERFLMVFDKHKWRYFRKNNFPYLFICKDRKSDGVFLVFDRTAEIEACEKEYEELAKTIKNKS